LNLTLIGFMGAGKSTVGALLGQRLGIPVHDLDTLLEEKIGGIPAFFDAFGEEAFRREETKLLQEMKEEEGILITGGGIVTSKLSQEVLAELYPVIYLHTSAETAFQRITLDEENERPLADSQPFDELVELFEFRQPLYEASADFTVDTDGSTPEKVAETILAEFPQFLHLHPKKLGFLGPQGSFSEEAARRGTPEEWEKLPYPQITDCLVALDSGKVDFAILPVENTIEGSVHMTVDSLFHMDSVKVLQEVVLPIHQQLLVHPAHQNEWKKARKILSHPQALAQSRLFIEQELPQIQEEITTSTAAAAQFIAEHPEENLLAIAPLSAAEVYGLAVAEKNIQDLAVNQTRFWLLGKDGQTLDVLPPAKISLILTMPNDTPGILHQALSCFAWRNISLSKIESRPMKTTLGEYFFLLDVLLPKKAVLIENALEEIELLGGKIKTLGTYGVELLK
jgi:prephenate dehydratase/shikimate kinase